jgi:hypothetical protein
MQGGAAAAGLVIVLAASGTAWAEGEGFLWIECNVEGARVYVDGEPAAVTPLAGPLVLEAGEHTVVVEADGHVTRERQCSVREGWESTCEMNLLAMDLCKYIPCKEGYSCEVHGGKPSCVTVEEIAEEPRLATRTSVKAERNARAAIGLGAAGLASFGLAGLFYALIFAEVGGDAALVGTLVSMGTGLLAVSVAAPLGVENYRHVRKMLGESWADGHVKGGRVVYMLGTILGVTLMSAAGAIPAMFLPMALCQFMAVGAMGLVFGVHALRVIGGEEPVKASHGVDVRPLASALPGGGMLGVSGTF